MKRIHWNEDQWKIVLTEAAKILSENSYLSHVKAVARAQTKLPQLSRRKNVVNLPEVRTGQLESLLKSLLKEGKNSLPSSAEAISKNETVPQQTLGQMLGAALDEALERANNNTTAVTQVRHQLLMMSDQIDTLNGEIASLRRLFLLLLQELGSSIPASLEAPEVSVKEDNCPPDKATPEATKQKTKICIIGLKGNQQTIIQKEFMTCNIAFNFIDQDRARNARNVLPQSGFIIVLVRFVDHTVTGKLKNHCSGNDGIKLIEIGTSDGGGMDALRKKIREILE